MSEKIEGYPYLKIAKKYGIPYEDVLAMADYVTHDRGREQAQRAWDKHGSSVYGEILSAAATFDAIRHGRLAFQ